MTGIETLVAAAVVMGAVTAMGVAGVLAARTVLMVAKWFEV